MGLTLELEAGTCCRQAARSFSRGRNSNSIDLGDYAFCSAVKSDRNSKRVSSPFIPDGSIICLTIEAQNVVFKSNTMARSEVKSRRHRYHDARAVLINNARESPDIFNMYVETVVGTEKWSSQICHDLAHTSNGAHLRSFHCPVPPASPTTRGRKKLRRTRHLCMTSPCRISFYMLTTHP